MGSKEYTEDSAQCSIASQAVVATWHGSTSLHAPLRREASLQNVPGSLGNWIVRAGTGRETHHLRCHGELRNQLFVNGSAGTPGEGLTSLPCSLGLSPATSGSGPLRCERRNPEATGPADGRYGFYPLTSTNGEQAWPQWAHRMEVCQGVEPRVSSGHVSRQPKVDRARSARDEVRALARYLDQGHAMELAWS